MNKKGLIAAITGAILFGTAGVFIKAVYSEGLDSISLLTLQYIIAVPILFFLAFLKNKNNLKISKTYLLKLAVLGVMSNTFMTIFYYKAYEKLPIAIVTLLLYTYPIIVFLYKFILKKDTITFKKICALLIAFIGCILTLNIFSSKLSYPILGIVFGILSAIFYAFMNVYSEEKLKEISPLVINTYSTLFSLVSLIIYRFPVFLYKTHISFKALFFILLLALICEIIPLTLLYYSIKQIGSLKVSIISNLEIPTSILLGFLLLQESISPPQIIGSTLIILAIYFIKQSEA